MFIFDIDKDADCLQSKITTLWFILTLVFSFEVWFSNRNNMKLRLFVILIVSLLFFLHKHIKTPDHHEAIRSCSRHECFTFDYMDTFENIQSLRTQLTTNYFSISMLKCENLNSFSQFLLLLTGDITLNRGHVHQGTLNVRIFLITEVYITFTWILTVCYQISRNFVLLQNLPVLDGLML